MMKLLWISFVLIKVVNLSEISYYEILGLSKQASAQEIRQAYKKLVVKFHPDKNPNVVEQETFLKITEAYETLKDPDKRHKYDIHDSYPSYTRKYDYHSQSEYNNLYYNGLYHNDPFVDSLSGGTYYDYLQEGFQFINFYSPFCPPCQNLVNPWKKLAELYKGVVKVAAVNCKYYNSFCYNSMRINSYPSLIFYPNGKTGNYVNYRGDRTFEVLERFIISYLRSNTVIPTVTHLRTTEEPTAYILGTYMIEDHALLRIAYKLKGLVTIAIVQDDNLWDKLTKNEYIIVVFKYKDTTVEIENTEEKEILKRIVDTLPKIELIQPEKLKEIRNELRNGSKTAWIIYFSSKGHDRLLSHQMRHVYPDMHFGEINCDKWVELCASLQADSPPAWAALKAGGAYQIMPGFVDIRTYIRTAVSATTLHSLSVSDLLRILDGDVGMWVLLIVPYGLAWDHLIEPFTRASLHYTNSQDINFGMMVCTLPNDKHCRRLAGAQPAVTVRAHAETHAYRGQLAEPQLVEFVELLSTTTDMDLTENQILEIMDPSSRYKSWLVAFLPARCGSLCDQLLHEWRLVFKKLKPLEIVRVGALQCSRQASGLCHNVRSPTARFYPVTSDQHYTVNLQYLSQAPYMLEWALEYIDDSIRSLDWSAFTTHVAADELHPTSLKKPWLVYFHSPKCYHCYEMYADFAITGIILSNAVRLGKVNCVNERNLCRHEHITAYPSLKLYLNRNHNQAFSSIISLPVADYATLLQEIKPLVMSYNENSLAGLDLDVVSEGFHVKHDEF